MFTQEELKLMDEGLRAVVDLEESRAADRALFGDVFKKLLPPNKQSVAGDMMARKEAEMKTLAEKKHLQVNALRGKIAGLLLQLASDAMATGEENPFSDITAI